MTRDISHYRIEGELGRGGMGVVYRAVDTRLGRPVAIKVLPPQATRDADRRRRFIHEARSASALNHPNIVTIYEVDEHEGVTFIAMELVEGMSLDKVLAAGALPVSTALSYAVQMASALEAAHALDIVHRDIKPANVVIAASWHASDTHISPPSSAPAASPSTPGPGLSGRVKVLDFGLAKLVARPETDVPGTATGTIPGTIIGTASYMSPEQAQGLPVDARSDVFSLGAVVYEMLAGRRPFAASSDVGILSAILRDAPTPLRQVRPDLPAAVEAIVARALSKHPEARYANAGGMRASLEGAQAGLSRPPEAAWRRPAVLVPAAIVLLALAALGVWQTVQMQRSRWARLEAIPEIERLNLSGRTMHGVRLAREAERYAPDEIREVRRGWLPFVLVTVPEGAQIEAKNYRDLDGPWEPLGPSPVRVTLPFAYYRVRVTKPGYTTIEVSAMQGRAPVKLTAETSASPGMVFVPGGRVEIGVTSPVTLPDYWIDRHEVTNAEFKRFVDAGGYREAKYWRQPFVEGDRIVPFADAIARFRDATGMPGPRTWELGHYPEGRADYPVGGVSWFEAAAYAAFAGKSLPTLYHWFRAAGTNEIYSDILQLSNFDGKGPSKAGERAGLGPWGTLDMAGNVKEWCANEVTGRGLRYILGGSWNEPSYRFAEEDGQDPWERRDTFGLRLVKSLGSAEHAAGPVGRVMPEPGSVVPVPAAQFEIYKRSYEYDRTPLEARQESVDDSSPYWRREKVSFTAAYGNQRVPAFLFLPKNATPPYQTVVFFPSAYGRQVSSSASLDLATFEFIVRSGRAVLYPVYQGTFERRGNVQPGRSGLRDMQVEWGKDLFRAVDYLETRRDIDMQRLAYYSLSMGAYFGPIPVALEPRIKVAVFASGGLRYGVPPEVQPANFAPHVKVPALLVSGKDDFGVPVEAQKRFLALLGTPDDHKKHVILEGGHVAQDIRGLFREVLAWLDKYQGTVK
jgi:eukaryotic-like serine/threonine-protein kinase